MKYLIRKAGQKPGTEPSIQPAVVGRTYACMELYEDGLGPMERAGVLVRYDGEGMWSDPDDDECDDAAHWVADADYLQEQY